MPIKTQNNYFCQQHFWAAGNKYPGESPTEPVNGKFEPSREKDLKAFCFDHHLSKSEVLRDSFSLFEQLYPFYKTQKAKGPEHWASMIQWLNSMP